MFSTYVLRSESRGQFYLGSISDVAVRLHQHDNNIAHVPKYRGSKAPKASHQNAGIFRQPRNESPTARAAAPLGIHAINHVPLAFATGSYFHCWGFATGVSMRGGAGFKK